MVFNKKFATTTAKEKAEMAFIILFILFGIALIGYSIGITIQSFMQKNQNSASKCIPNCSAGTNCGLNSDGCGGICECSAGTKCLNNQCVANEGCKPNCVIGTCGASDGCGNICDCQPDETCISGKCNKIPDQWSLSMYKKLKETIISSNSDLEDKPSLVSCIANNIVDKYKNPQTLIGDDFKNSLMEIMIGCKTKSIRDPGVPKFNKPNKPSPPGPQPDGNTIFNLCKNKFNGQAIDCVSDIVSCGLPMCLDNPECIYDLSAAAQNFCESISGQKGRPGNPGRSKHRPNSNPNQPRDDPNLVVSYCDDSYGPCSCVTTTLGLLRQTEKINHTVFPGTTCDNGCGEGNCETNFSSVGVH